jgi:hypothetical protein
MRFILSALEGQDVDEIFKNVKRDEEMNQYRDVLFRQ